MRTEEQKEHIRSILNKEKPVKKKKKASKKKTGASSDQKDLEDVKGTLSRLDKKKADDAARTDEINKQYDADQKKIDRRISSRNNALSWMRAKEGVKLKKKLKDINGGN
jgi:hypothetical protein